MSSSPSRRPLAVTAVLALVTGLLPLGAASRAATGDPVLINEVLVSTTGTDVEFAELYGIPGTSLAGLSLIAVESDTGTTYGSIDARRDFTSADVIGGNGYHLVGNAGVTTTYGVTPNSVLADGFMENSSLTIAIVVTSSIAGTSVTGAEVVRDAIGIMDSAAETPALDAPGVGPDGAFLPAGAHRISVGVDTDAATDWALADFSLVSTTNPNTPIAGTPFGGTGEVVADCGDGVRTIEGAAGSATVTASDADGTVTAFSIVSVAPSDPGTFSIGTVTPSGATGAPASAQLLIGATTPDGAYTVTVQASNSDTTPQTDTCELTVTVDPVLTIGEVQGPTTDGESGTADRSPLVGQTVAVRGVVTQRLRLPTSSGGQNYAFFLQSTIAAADGDARSSDGLYVFLGSTPFVDDPTSADDYFAEPGDQVVLRGLVQESFNLTQLGSSTVRPQLLALEREDVPMSELEVTEADPDDSLATANRWWERHEAMQFHLDAGSAVVGARDLFTLDAEVWVVRGDHPLAERTDPYARRVFRDVHPLDDSGPAGSWDNGNGMRILLTNHGLKWNEASNLTLLAPARTYDTVTNAVTGGLTYTFGKYGIEVQQQLVLESGADPALNAPPSAAVAGAEYATSDYNVENLYDFRNDPNDGCDFAGDPGCPGVRPPFNYVPVDQADYEQHLADLAAQIAGPMHAPDILAIQEAEDQDICSLGDGELLCGSADDADGRPDTLQDLALAIQAAGGPVYDTAFDRDGADDRGIVSAFMWRVDTVELLPASAGDPVLGSETGIDYPGTPLAYNAEVSNPKAVNAILPAGVPGPIDACDAEETNRCVYTRDPQVGHFRVWRDGIGTSVFTDLWALSNHFSSTPDSRVGQRTQQAVYNAAIYQAIVAADPGARVVTLGDFNVYPRPDDPFAPGDSRHPSDQLAALYDAGLHNLYDTLLAEVPQSAYSYVFQGQTQTLDMQFANQRLFDELVQVRAAHLNADYAAGYDGDGARGASDHDPQIARWSKAVDVERLADLVEYLLAGGEIDPAKAQQLLGHLDQAATLLAAGDAAGYLDQLEAFANQAQGLAPRWISQEAADILEQEADTVTGA